MSLAPAPCHHKVKHAHGTLNAYLQDGCRCDDCRDANTAAMRAYRATQRTSMVPTTQARTHIRGLLATGHTWHSIATQARLNPQTVQAIIEGIPTRAEPPRTRIRATTANRILGVQPVQATAA